MAASNWDVSLHEQLDRTGLTPLLDGALSSAEVGAPKPDPEIFVRALALAGARPEEAWHVGDDVEADVGGAPRGPRAGADRPRRAPRAPPGVLADRLARRAAGALCVEWTRSDDERPASLRPAGVAAHAPRGARRDRPGRAPAGAAGGALAAVPAWAPLAAMIVAFVVATIAYLLIAAGVEAGGGKVTAGGAARAS